MGRIEMVALYMGEKSKAHSLVEHFWLPIGGKMNSRRICGGIALQEKTVRDRHYISNYDVGVLNKE